MRRFHLLSTLASLALVASISAVLAPSRVTSQQLSADGVGECGSGLTPEEARIYLELQAGGPPQLPPFPASPPYCVPIAGHIVRSSAGTGGMSLSQYNQAIADANEAFANTGIVFYSLGVDYIDDDYYYTEVSGSKLTTLRQQNVVAAAINVYFAPVTPGLCGISSFTFSTTQGIIQNNGCTGVPGNPSTFPHEVGHYFDLFHTHETAFGAELVNGSNCATAGDRLCDTPADPVLGSGNVTAACDYFGTATDANGDSYHPDPLQYMSYSRALCRTVFSPQSEAKIVETLLALRPELLSRGCSPFGDPTVTHVDPPQGFVDQTLDVLIEGTNLGIYTTVQFGDGITLNSVDTISTDSLLVNVTVAVDADLGPRDIIVNNSFTPDTLFAAFSVTPTYRHYVASGGGNVYPYALPEHAAPTLADVFAAAAIGDTVYADTTTISNVTAASGKGLYISGGWMNNFTTRDLALARTTIELSNNINFYGPSPQVFDGFHLKNGRGTARIMPENGRFGGGIQISKGHVTISNCIIESCVGSSTSSYSGGGGIFADSSTVNIIDNVITDCKATVGGGIYLYACHGTVSNNVITGNMAVTGGTATLVGAGVALKRCSNVTLSNNTLGSNTGAYNGGGYWLQNSGDITITGGSVEGCSAGFAGAGAYIDTSDVVVEEVRIQANTASVIAGAINSNASTVTLSRCSVLDNTALIGGGIYVTGGETYVRHNLLTGNSASNTAGGIYVSGVAAGEIIGNTLDDNSGPLGVGGIFVANSPLALFNNIIANSTGHGLGCSGVAPVNTYNLVWNSTGNNYDGCSPGTGARDGNPQFLDAASADYHLALNSPAIDAGSPEPATNDPDGSRGDMGRYGSHAFTMSRPSYPKGLDVQISGSDAILTWSRNPESDIASYAVYGDSTSAFIPGATNLITLATDTTVTLVAATDTVYYRIAAIDLDGYASGYSDEVPSVPSVASALQPTAQFRTALQQNHPNPFNPETRIRFTLARREAVHLVVYDVAGRRIRALLDETRSAGPHEVTWDGKNDSGSPAASGVYFYRLLAGEFSQTRKMLLLK